MEPAALMSSLLFLKAAGIRLTHLVTDRSITVRTLMQSKFPEINHQFDIWHFIKNIKKSLFKLTKLGHGVGGQITKWFSSIVNHLWFALGSSQGR